MNISFQKLFYAIATVSILFAIMIIAKQILIPLSIALLIAFILLPLANRFEKWKISKPLAAFLSILTMILLIGGVIYFFSTQIITLASEFSDIKDKIIRALTDVTVFLNSNVSFVPNMDPDELFTRLKEYLSNSTGSLVTKTFSSTASFIAALMATIVFIFLFLIYRVGFTHAFLEFASENNRGRVYKMLKSIQLVGQKYLSGMMLLTVVIGLANSIGLLIIGIDNPFLFGFLGAALSIIPYVGTAMGAVIPVIYAFVSYDAIWMTFAVALLFWFVQLVSDNFLSPRIVGGSLKVNALTAILSLFVGAFVWGVAGMILFLPFAAILKVICEEFEELKPIAQIIGEQNMEEDNDDDSIIARWWEKIKRKFSG